MIGVAPQAQDPLRPGHPGPGRPELPQVRARAGDAIQQSLADGIDYAVAHGAKVISMSIGYGAPSGTVREALLKAYHGVVVVASAGIPAQPARATTARRRSPTPPTTPA